MKSTLQKIFAERRRNIFKVRELFCKIIAKNIYKKIIENICQNMYQKYLPKYLRKSLLKYLREIYLHERKMFYVTKFEESFSANVFVHNKAESSWMPIFTCLLSKFFT